jgi:hypothetical protein
MKASRDPGADLDHGIGQASLASYSERFRFIAAVVAVIIVPFHGTRLTHSILTLYKEGMNHTLE